MTNPFQTFATPVELSLDGRGKKVAKPAAEWRTHVSTPAELAASPAHLVDCGRTGIVVVDLDRGDVDGVALWAERGYPRSTFVVRTQAGGEHHYFRAVDDRPRSYAQPTLGVDVRGIGGCVFGPGSVVRGGGAYALAEGVEWPSSVDALPPAPVALLDELRAEHNTNVRAAAALRRPEVFQSYPASADAVDRCRLDVEQAWAVLEESVSGGFNDALLRVCCAAARWFATRNAADDEDGPFTVDDARQYVVDRMLESDEMGPPDSADEQTIYNSRTVEQAFDEPSHHIGRALQDSMVAGIIERQGGLTPPPTYTAAPPAPAYSANEAIARTDDDKLALFRAEFLSVAQLGSLPKPKWLLHGLLPAAGLARVSGNPGSYKSFLALDWALSVATGRNWQGLHTRPGPVIYVAGEGAAGSQDRVKAWLKHNGVDDVPADQFLFLPRTVLTLDVEWELMTALVEELRPSLVVLDTQQRVSAGVEENSAKETSELVARWDWLVQHGATVLLVHHLGKDASKGARGSSVVKASVDTELTLTRPENALLATLTVDKQKNAEAVAPWEMVAEKVVISPPHDPHTKVIEMLETSLILRRATETDRDQAEAGLTRRILDKLEWMSANDPDATFSGTDIRHALEITEGDAAALRTMQRAMNHLVAGGRVVAEGRGRGRRYSLLAAEDTAA